MKITQIIEKEGQIFGLGEDNLMYQWRFDGLWHPYWDTRTQEEKDRITNQLSQSGGGTEAPNSAV